MRQLRKVLGCVLSILIFQLIKMTLDDQSGAYSYYYNLLSCTQLFILGWCGFSILIEESLLKRFLKRHLMAISFGIYLLVISVLEITCTYWLNNPQKIPSSLFIAIKIYYDHFDCKIIQYDKRFSRYDQALFYSLKNNQQFVFSNREYSDTINTNSAGLRDDEHSLDNPEIICVGDSYTLGWGNSETTNFPAMLEKRTGLKVLNVGMSSYGTARELIKLKQVDLSSVRYIFWQYCYNDWPENDAYLRNGRSLPVRPSSSFDSIVQIHKWTREYFPFRHVFTLTKLTFRFFLLGNSNSGYSRVITNSTVQSKTGAIEFLEILRELPVDFSKTKVVVFELGPHDIQSNFTQDLRKVINEKSYSALFKGNLSVVDTRPILDRNDYYSLDVHIKTEGNKKLTDVLVEIIGRKSAISY